MDQYAAAMSAHSPTFGRPSRLRDAKDVLTGDQQVHDPEPGNESANVRIAREHAQRRGAMQQRIERPHPRPGNNEEKEAGFDAVQGEEERDRHSGDSK